MIPVMQAFRLNGSRVLEVDLQGDAVRAATGSMVAYDGDVAVQERRAWAAATA